MFEESSDAESPPVEVPADAVAVERIGAAVRRERLDAFDRLDAIADLIVCRQRQSLYTFRQRWAVDGWASIQAEVAAASGCSIRAAGKAMWTASDLRSRLPRVNEVFRRGLLSVQVVSAITYHTHLITDPAVADAVDAELASQCVGFGVLSEAKCVAAIQDVVATVDPDAVRRCREKLRGRGVWFGKRDDVTGAVSFWGSLTAPDAAVVQARLEQMASTVCGHDPRSERQRLSDAAGALARGQSGLQCLCGSQECDAPDPGESLARLHLYVVADEQAANTAADPDIHGGPHHDDGDGDGGDGEEPWWAHPDSEPPTHEPEPGSAPEPVAEPADGATDEPRPQGPRTADTRAPRPESGEFFAEESRSAAPDAPSPAGSEAAAAGEDARVVSEASGSDADSTSGVAQANSRSDEPTPNESLEPEPRSAGEVCPQPDTDGLAVDGEPPPQRGIRRHRGYGPAALILGGGWRLTPAQVGDLVRGGAQVRRITDPDTAPESHYRFSAALAAYIRARDLHCRWPHCEKPADRCDVDHTVPYPHGSTHPSNGKCYCRFDHLLKTFWGGENGWSDIQLPDGTVIVTAPTGHTYRTVPDSHRLFPWLNPDTGPAPPGPAEHKPDSPDKGLKMPTRNATREQQRHYRITAERKRNQELREQHDDP